MKNTFWIFLLSITFFGSAFSQQAICEVDTIKFGCPSRYFKEVKTNDRTIRLFKYTGTGDDLFFFISVADDPGRVGKLVLATYPKRTTDKIVWKKLDDPFVMSTKTTYDYEVHASLALTDDFLFEVKSFLFDVNKRKFVLGYVSSLSDESSTNKSIFKTGKAIGDHAAGCNAVVTALNTVTKEFPEKEQYCFLMTLSAPK